MDLRHTVDRIQNLVSAETGRRLGADAEATLSQLLRNGAAYPQRNDGFTRRELTILFADLRGFMAITNRYPPETVLQVLNRCLVRMIEVVCSHEGTIDKFMGDSIMAHFSEVPSGQDPAQLLKKYGKRFKLMHVKDLRKGVKGDFSGGTSQENDVALGTGQINIAEVIKAAQQSGIEHYYIEDESSSVKTQVPQSLKFLKSL